MKTKLVWFDYVLFAATLPISIPCFLARFGWEVGKAMFLGWAGEP